MTALKGAAMSDARYQHQPLSGEDRTRLERLFGRLQDESAHFLGYPCNRNFDYSELYRFLAFPVNNVGDPYVDSNYHLQTHAFEREVLAIFEQLTEAPAGETWGYVTNGGTEGNHYGLFLARELYPTGVVYYSQDAHYSIGKVLRCLGLPSIMVRSRPDGSMDLDDLRETLRIHRSVPPIVCATVGTTMKGAVDEIAAIHGLFEEFALERHYLHADAALSGMILPFVEDPPAWNFRAGVDSIAISGHKMIGSPIPCGVVLAKKANVERIASGVEYIGTLDTTLTGSRNGHTPLFLWYAFHTTGLEGFRRIIPGCLAMAEYAVERLAAIGLEPWRHSYSNTVVFNRPRAEITSRWQLACQGTLSHLITMPHVTREQIDRLISDIEQPQAHRDTTAAIEPAAAHTAASEPIVLVGTGDDDLLDRVSQALAAEHISIDELTAVSVDEGSVVRVRVSDRPRALRILNEAVDMGRDYGRRSLLAGEQASQLLSRVDYQQAATDAVLVRLDDRVGEFASLAHQCHEAGLQLRTVRILWRGKKTAIAELTTSEPSRLRALLAERVIVDEDEAAGETALPLSNAPKAAGPS
jgi:histidine decarboxylase